MTELGDHRSLTWRKGGKGGGGHNNAPCTMYEGDKAKDAQRRGQKGLMRPQHVNNNVGEHYV